MDRSFESAAFKRGIPVKTLELRHRLDMRSVFRLRTWLRGQRATVIHVHGYKALLYGLLAKSQGMRVVATLHGHTRHDRRARVYATLHDALLRGADGVVAVHQDLFIDLPHLQLQKKCWVVDNPISLRMKDLAAPLPPRGGVNFLFLGRLSREKGLAEFIEAMRRCLNPQTLTLTVVGDGHLRRDLEIQAASLPPGRRVVFAGRQSDIRPFLAAADAVVMPSWREGMPMAALEALAFGRPLLGSRVGALPDLIEDGINGLLLPRRNVPAWTAGIDSFLGCQADLAKCAHQNRTSIWKQFGPHQWAQKTLTIYQEVGAP
jgi:glycosyltransferase involved in cell wall biosynthesis